jgi:ABC-2 type transport system permease protein
VRRYTRLYIAFLRNCLRQAAEFRANFWASAITNFGWMLALVVLISIIYHNTTSVAGWSQSEMLVLYGTYTIMRGVSNTLFYQNLSQLPLFVRKGQMDWILTKPVNSQFYASLRFVELSDLGSCVGGIVVVVFGDVHLHLAHPPTLATVLLFCVMLASSVVIFYSLTMLLMTLSFWLVRLDNLMVLSDTVFQIARTPIDIFGVFGPAPRFFLTYILPLAFIAAMPVKELFSRVDAVGAATASILVAAIFFTASVVFWRYATRNYSSASS